MADRIYTAIVSKCGIGHCPNLTRRVTAKGTVYTCWALDEEVTPGPFPPNCPLPEAPAKEAEAAAMRSRLQDVLNWMRVWDTHLNAKPDYFTARAKIEAALASNAGAEMLARLKALGDQLEFDRTAVADCLTAANKAIDARHWLTEGRGSYEWNDDRYRDEFKAAALEIKAALEPLTKVAANWKDCPQSAMEIADARIDLLARLRAAEEKAAALETLIPLVEKLLDSINADQSQIDKLSNFHKNYQAVVNALAAIEAARTKERFGADVPPEEAKRNAD